MWDSYGSSLCHISYQKNVLRTLTYAFCEYKQKRGNVFSQWFMIFLATAMRTIRYSFPVSLQKNTLYNTEEKDLRAVILAYSF